MERLKLSLELKKEIIVNDLKRRDSRFETESISAFVERLLDEYCYSKGAERLFWVAIKDLEEEGKVVRLKNGKRKNIFLLTQPGSERRQKNCSLFEKKFSQSRIKVIKDFLISWELCESIK